MADYTQGSLIGTTTGYQNPLSKLNINGNLYSIKDARVDTLATNVATALNALDSKIDGLETISVVDGGGANPVTGLTKSGGVITVNHGTIPTSAVTSTTALDNTVTTLAGHLTALENKLSDLSGIDTTVLADIQKIISELQGCDNSVAGVWVTLVDKLKGLSINSEDKTVKQYVDYYVTALENSISEYNRVIASSLTDLDSRVTNVNTRTTTLESHDHTHAANVSFKDWAITLPSGSDETVTFTSSNKSAAGVPTLVNSN